MSADIHEALVKIRSRCPYIQKLGQMNNSGGHYSYAQLEDVIHHTRPLMDDEQVTIFPSDFELLANAPIGTRRLVMLKVTYRLTHAPSKTFIEVRAPGEGADSGDKACNKAMAAAEKLAVLQALYIERGNDDPDKYPSDESAQLASAFKPGKGEAAAKLTAALKAIEDADTADRVHTLMAAAIERAWTQEQYDAIAAKANIQLDTFAAF
jgi:hypothetical protein